MTDDSVSEFDTDEYIRRGLIRYLTYGRIKNVGEKTAMAIIDVFTVHKYQGSECDAVVVVMTDKMPPILLNRNLLYTVVSRAKKQLFLIGNKCAFERAARTSIPPRVTGLKDLRLV